MTPATLDETLGFSPHRTGMTASRACTLDFVNLKLASRGFPLPAAAPDSPLLDFGRSVLANFEEKLRILGASLCPADQTINEFLAEYLGEAVTGVFEEGEPMLPADALNLERHGLARELSLPADADSFVSGILSSYRVAQGVCHNPAKDRRTTEGVFHIVDGGRTLQRGLGLQDRLPRCARRDGHAHRRQLLRLLQEGGQNSDFLCHQFKFRNQKIVTRYLRVGFNEDGSWRTFGLRKDFVPAVKLQREDDITASTVVASANLSGLHPHLKAPAYKFATNCEFRLFQRPDDAVIRGYDLRAEADFAKPGQFFSNYEPLPRAMAQDMIDDAIRFGQFTPPMQDLIHRVATSTEPDYFVCTANPRLVEGKPTKNPRYLQTRPDLENPRAEYLAEVGAKFYRRLPAAVPVLNPVHAVLPGRRNNPAEPGSGIRPLAVYGPVHHQELPELFADLLASLTGKSPSTTGAGSEGALTKSPFNALLPIHDLNAALLSFVVTSAPVFTTAAGHIGRRFRVEHDISLIIPEVWARMYLHEREPEWLLDHDCLEPVRDFTHDGRKIEASRLGCRITPAFVTRFFGRVFADPGTVFTSEQLRPEEQSVEEYVDGVEHIIEGQQKAAAMYFADGGIHQAVPPLAALLHILAHGAWEGHGLKNPAFRQLFATNTVLGSEWYRARLEARLSLDKRLWQRHADDLRRFLDHRSRLLSAERAEFNRRLATAEQEIAALENADASTRYAGTLGRDPHLG